MNLLANEFVFIILFIVAILLLVPLLIYVLFINTLQNTLKKVSGENRSMEPWQAWLLLIPLFNFVWHFIIVRNIADSLKAEFADRGIKCVENYPAYGTGIAMSVLFCLIIIPALNFIAFLAFCIVLIIYWIKIEEYKNKLQLRSNDFDDEKSKAGDDFKYQDSKISSQTKKETEPEKKAEPTENEGNKNQHDKSKLSIEKYIGKNIINIAGIIVLLIGVAIGIQYSVRNFLIGPWVIIVLSYILALGLLGLGIKLKEKYDNYSAVLVSGAIAIIYFITYIAYSFYDLMPHWFAFLLMIIFTGAAVYAAISYNKQIIALIGMVGAYAIPFLLINMPGNPLFLFSYVLIINAGILLIVLKKYWKPLFYISFVFTWILFFVWYVFYFQSEKHFIISLIFLLAFFAVFYTSFLAYKLIYKEKFETGDSVFLLLNSFLFFGIGYSILSTDRIGEQLLGGFALFNAIIHFIVSIKTDKRNRIIRNELKQFVAGLVVVFIAITIPVQTSGKWVSILWIGQATLLFWLGKSKNISVYEKLAYPVMLLALISLVINWSGFYNGSYQEASGIAATPFLNSAFFTSLVFIAAFGFINFLNNNNPISFANSQKQLKVIINYTIPAVLLIIIYYTFRLEISAYWTQFYIDPGLEPAKIKTYDLEVYRKIWLMNYTLLFFIILSFVNFIKHKSRTLGLINIAFNVFVLIVFATHGLSLFGELRESYLNQLSSGLKPLYSLNIWIKYISFIFAGGVIFSIYKYLCQSFIKPFSDNIKVGLHLFIHFLFLCIISSEFISWMDIMRFSHSYKLGLSIIWGLYALFLIILGIWKNRTYIRIAAIVLFGATLLKLFFYDIIYLNALEKTIVFISLGVLLLVSSFLYNKYMIKKESDN